MKMHIIVLLGSELDTASIQPYIQTTNQRHAMSLTGSPAKLDNLLGPVRNMLNDNIEVQLDILGLGDDSDTHAQQILESLKATDPKQLTINLLHRNPMDTSQ